VLALDDLLRDVDRGMARRMVVLVGGSVALGMMNVVLLGAPVVLSSGAGLGGRTLPLAGAYAA